jgi:2-haloalkanoic acid dehalogenase type II
MAAQYDIITFDCYGTLVDWRGGIVRAFEQAGVVSPGVTPEGILALHAEIEPVVQGERYRPYRDVLRITAQRMIEKMGGQVPPDGGDFLPKSVPTWPPFPDTNTALTRMRSAGVELGILSNIDDELLEQTLRQIDVDFTLVVTAQQVGAYKPNHAHFHAARDRIGDRRWLHAAQSYFHDIVPAHELGIPSAWVNRLAEAPSGEARARTEVPDLTGLADRIVA